MWVLLLKQKFQYSQVRQSMYNPWPLSELYIAQLFRQNGILSCKPIWNQWVSSQVAKASKSMYDFVHAPLILAALLLANEHL